MPSLPPTPPRGLVTRVEPVHGRVTVPPPRRRPEHRRVAADGEIDVLTAPELHRMLRRHLGDLPAGSVLVVDLSGVTHFSASGVTALRAAADAARDRHVGFRLGRISRQVDRVLELCRIDFPRFRVL